MKSNSNYLNLKTILSGILMIFLLFGACRKLEEGNIQPNEEVSIILRVKLPSTPIGLKTYAITADDENELQEIDVLVFNVDGTNERFSYRTTGQITDEEGIIKLTASLRRDENTDNKYRLVVLANAREQLNAYGINLNEKKEHLQNNLVYEHADHRWEAKLDGTGDFMQLPMWGETAILDGMTTIEEEEEIDLLRALARVDVLVDDNPATATFTLDRVHIFYSQNSGLIIPNMDKLTNGEPSLPETENNNSANVLEYEVADNTLEREIYLFETAVETDPADATALVIEGTFEDDPDNSYYYRIDFRNEVGDFMPLLRNNRYVINIISAGFDSEEDHHDNRDDAFAAPSLMPISHSETDRIKSVKSKLTSSLTSYQVKNRAINYTITTINKNQ